MKTRDLKRGPKLLEHFHVKKGSDHKDLLEPVSHCISMMDQLIRNKKKFNLHENSQKNQLQG